MAQQAFIAQAEVATAGPQPSRYASFLTSLVLVAALAVLANRLGVWVNTLLGKALVEYPLWAVSLGLVANVVLRASGLRERLSQAFRTELFLKTGLVLMGATVDFREILAIGAQGIVQAIVLITSVFFFTWYLTGRIGLDQKLRALMSAAVSICGISAAIAATGAVVARREQLAYVTALVILFAMPLMILQPIAARLLDLSPEVAGAWIGGNIDTTAAVVGAGALHSERAMKIASIVKITQGAFVGLAAFLLALYFAVVVERKPDRRPRLVEIWHRFPKFVLGFALASLVVSLGLLGQAEVMDLTNLRNWFLTLAFVSIGLEFAFGELRRLGIKPLAVYFMATAFNTLAALALAYALFGGLIKI